MYIYIYVYYIYSCFGARKNQAHNTSFLKEETAKIAKPI